MLTQHPIFAAAVPRFHIGPRTADGSRLVDDRASARRFRVYTPRLDVQFRAGYRAGLWYLRAVDDLEPSPRSPGYATAGEAVATLRDASHRTAASPKSCHPHCRVVWS